LTDPGIAHVLDVLPDGVVIADARAVVTHANAEALRLLEVGSSVVPGAALRDVVALQNLEGSDWSDCIAPYGGLPGRRFLLESSWWTASGCEVLVTGRLHRDRPGGTVDQVALVIRDARSRRVVDRERSDLVATVAHELRSPLTGVKGFTSTLLSKWERFTESQKLLMLRTVDADADRLTRLIAELLDVARIDSGRLTIRKEPVDVAEAVTRQVGPLSAAHRDIEVQVLGRPLIWADRDKLAQVTANLVENALRHGEGDVCITVAEAPGGGAEVIVDDAGDGIEESIRTRVFTKFWRNGRAGGSGLGLYIVGGLVKAHEGTVHIESSPAGGARMRVVLPAGTPSVVT
jgi:signal transduction histidine kinase